MNSLYEKKLVRSSHVSFKSVMDEVVILNHVTGNYYTLNPTGTCIWNYCSEAKSYQEILSFLSQEYQTKAASIKTEISFYLEELLKEGLLEILENK